MNSKYLQTIVYSIIILMLSGCYDDFAPSLDVVGEGMAEISAEVKFEPLTGSSTSTRSSGSLTKSIESLSVIVYTPNDKLFKVYNLDQTAWKEGYDEKGNTEMPKDADGKPIGNQAEATTASAKFKLPAMPYGRYKIYAVANMGDITDEQAADIEELKKTSLNWDSTDISNNNKMFGYFTYSDDTDGGASGFDARLLTINQNSKSHSVHAWIKRAISKVTVDFDPSGLKQDIWIYIHDVSIRDIPATCMLGEDNVPGYDDLLYHYNTPLSDLPASAKIIYGDDKELPEGTVDAYQDFKDLEVTESVYTKWLTLAKGSGIKGSDHSESANALYFFENMQGDFENEKTHNKEVLSSEIVGECITSPDQEGFKNGVIAGTYIEVTGYYVSQNIENTTQGKIKYRFMLGKNDTYNFNAQRNHHYKLTLGFDGWANQPKWNIEYYEEAPGMELPDQDYMSYLYNQRQVFPIKLVGDCTELKLEIVENNWAPYDASNSDQVPPAQVGTGDDAFLWNRAAWNAWYRQRVLTTDDPADTNNTSFGFLALALPVNEGDIPKNIIEHEFNEGGNGSQWQTQLKTYYDTNNGESNWNTGSQRVRTFSAAQLKPDGGEAKDGCYFGGYNGWQVNKVDDESNMVLVPLFTRNKSMINSSGFSGNNPYDSYQRKAVIRVTATFRKRDGSTEQIVKQVPILQVRRIVNPKGVWRTANSTNTTFDVKMLQITDVSAVNSSEYFSEYTSEGAWKAYIDTSNGYDFLDLVPLGKSYYQGVRTDTVYGDTDDPIEFQLKFKGVADNVSACAIVKVLYHGNNCVHKILVRQGIMEPLAVIEGGAQWSSFSLYSCGANAATSGSPQNIEATMTESPLALGSLFRRHNTLQGIRVINNETSFTWNNQTIQGRGPLVAPNGYQFVLTNGTRRQWYSSTYATPGNTNTYVVAEVPQYTSNTQTDNTSTWGTFRSTVNGVTRTYRLPSYDDFKALDDAEYGVGVLYGDNTTETQVTYTGSYVYEAHNNQFVGPATANGARGMILYNKGNGNQVFFPMGKDGVGRRTEFNTRLSADGPDLATYNGVLRYSDVSYVLAAQSDYYRPVPYNMPRYAGAIYWLNTTRRSGYANTYPCAGWDMNYFNVDFGPYPDNSPGRFRDARPIKLVVQ